LVVVFVFVLVFVVFGRRRSVAWRGAFVAVAWRMQM